MAVNQLWCVDTNQTYHGAATSPKNKVALRLIKERSDKKFDVFINSDNSIVRVTDDKDSFATVPYVCEIVRANHMDALPNGKFSFITKTTKNKYLLLKFHNWIMTECKDLDFSRDINVSDWVFYPSELQITDATKSNDENQLDIAQYKLLPIEMTHAAVNPDDFRLSNIFKKVVKMRKFIIGVVCVVLVIAVSAGGYLLYKDVEEKIVEKTVHVYVDDYEEYKKYSSTVVSLRDVSEPITASWLFLKSLPTGWEFTQVMFTDVDNMIVSRVKHAGGLVREIEAVKKESTNGKWLTVEGQNVHFSAPVSSKTEGMQKVMPHLDDVRSMLIDRATQVGAEVKSNDPKNQSNYKTQSFNLTFSDVNPSLLMTISASLNDLPMKVKTLTVSNKNLGVQTDIAIVIEIWGN